MSDAENGDSPYDGTEWEGYSNYQAVSQNVSQSISAALDSYAWLQGAHREGAGVRPEPAANARADILSAALRLYVEMQQEQANGNDDYDDILDRWGSDEDDEPGYIGQFHELRLTEGLPGWMLQFVMDIRTAGWQLGYLQAGRRAKKQPDDPVEGETDSMFGGM